MAARIRIGLSGWTYRHWRSVFYPPGLAQRRELEFAAHTFDALEINTYPSGTSPMLTDHARRDAADVLDGIRGRTGIEISVDEFLESPHVFIGSVDGLVAKLREQRERLGISSIMVGDLDTLAPVVERLAGT